MKRKVNQQIAVELLALSVERKLDLVKALVLRRLYPGEPLTRDQLETALKADFFEISEVVPGFHPEKYSGMDTVTLYKIMMVGMLINERNLPGASANTIPTQSGSLILNLGTAAPATSEDNEKILVERGARADEWLAALGEDFAWLVERCPMSTRGIFDNLKTKPGKDRTIDVTFDEFNATHKGSKKDVIFEKGKPDQRDRHYHSQI